MDRRTASSASTGADAASSWRRSCLVIAAIVSLGLAFGAAYPQLDTQNAAQIATGFGARRLHGRLPRADRGRGRPRGVAGLAPLLAPHRARARRSRRVGPDRRRLRDGCGRDRGRVGARPADGASEPGAAQDLDGALLQRSGRSSSSWRSQPGPSKCHHSVGSGGSPRRPSPPRAGRRSVARPWSRPASRDERAR